MDAINDSGEAIKLGEAIENILVESGLSLSAFSRKVGYSRQYLYELMKTKGAGSAHKVQLDTLKTICDGAGYSLRRLLIEIGYLSKPANDVLPNTVIVVKPGGNQNVYTLDERAVSILEDVAKAFARTAQSRS